MTKSPFTGNSERASELLGLVHTDVCGPISCTARGGFQYIITFTDDFSRYGYIYLMRHKSESFEKFKEFQNEVQNQLGKTIKRLRSDRGGEYLSHEFGEHLKQCGIVPQWTPPGTPQWNGVSERKNRTLLDMVRSMMSQSDLPLSFWGYALETAAFTLNRVPSKSVERTPYEIWTGKRPGLSFLKIWGCEAYVKRMTSDKLSSKSDKCFFVGYPRETKGYYFYNREEGKVFVARNGVFLEKEFLSKRVSGRTVQLEEVQEAPENVSSSAIPQLDEQIVVEPIVETPAPRRSERARRAPEKFTLLTTGQRDILLLDNDEPKTYSEAMMGPDSEKWLGAMRSELESMRENQVWNLIDPPDGVKTIECKWVFKKKIDMDGNVHIYKARLVAKGFKQIQGVDYDETFSPVAMLKSIRILLAIAAFYDYEIWQMDVKTAFLNGNLSEDVYMTQPEGFVDPQNARKICKLQRSIYGLKQASRSWNLRVDEDSKKGFLPMSHGVSLSKTQCPSTPDEQEKMRAIPYASAVGSIMYAMISTRPDVAYALSVVSRYQSNPGEAHWGANKNILKYLRRTMGMFLVYGGEEELVVNGYTDASFQTDKDDSRSQSGYVFCLNGGAVSWKSSKQDTVADSTTEAEYLAASEAAKEAVWIRKFVSELGVVPSASSPMDLYCDNSGAIAQAKEPRAHQKNKHILRRYHLIRDIVARGDVKICKVHTDSNIADPLTKPLSQPKHEAHMRSMGIRYLHD
ncbi:hypothetical protein QOZ80_7BG0600470 [Eleusine coracana subsp. coracana]|nr:hypothetical protein QOZ80_7BG0600470 [Eleusine coracana subsp. coracana]